VSVIQIVSVVVFLGVLAWVYLPKSWLSVAKSEPSLLAHVADIVSIRSCYRTPEVTEACNALLQVLLQVKQ
jgi:hypothetical protein